MLITVHQDSNAQTKLGRTGSSALETAMLPNRWNGVRTRME